AKQQRGQGTQPVDVAGYPDGGQERYAAAWGPADMGDEVRLVVGASAREYGTTDTKLLQAQLRPVVLHAFAGADGEVRYSAIWRKNAPRGDDFWQDDEATHTDRALSEGLLVDVSLTPSRHYLRDAQQEVLGWLSGSPWVGLYLRRQGEPALPHPERRYAGCFLGD